jgi:hypothetical protein
MTIYEHSMTNFIWLKIVDKSDHNEIIVNHF